MARRDYFYDPEAPRPNSIRPAAAVALFDSGGNILLLRRKDNDKWTMPGGTLDFGESLTDCAIREVREETGLQIRIAGLIGTYTDPHILIAYSNGEVRQEFTFVYAAEIESGELKIDDESKEAADVFEVTPTVADKLCALLLLDLEIQRSVRCVPTHPPEPLSGSTTTCRPKTTGGEPDRQLLEAREKSHWGRA
ncbi:MAG TPA: NUDIX domain-containing protein [Chthoniobacterales bacterium]|nr:NUDIX domain-containing protein [Chthoniobacterales bacterium]